MGFLQGGMLQLPSNGRHRPNSKRIRMPSLGYAPACRQTAERQERHKTVPVPTGPYSLAPRLFSSGTERTASLDP
ncbi:hypothetical protein HZH68_013205 [Vespula germanica]|uniref:Uncharacterized protein n=4 Tax=Vespula TaxID=7451 RepID=A0A834MYD6_VESGE|nr:hypothetical protein HZH68_013205 [Vespula germanica]KAF7409004.1 hypothetical protein H0235_013856 [Vespula pensylvanica]